MKSLIKSVYDAVPLKKEVYSLIKGVWTPPEKIFRHLHFKGVFRVPVETNHSFLVNHYGFAIENEIFWQGLKSGWENVSISLWIKLCKRADVIFDVGANTGIYSLIAKSMNKDAKVVAFEPVNRVFEKLQSNNRLNQYDIECIEAAASDTDGKATIYDSMGEHILSVTVNKNLNEPETRVEAVEINTMRLDSYISSSGTDRIDLMKIDVETHEFEVLTGMGKYLEEFKPVMLIEILEDEVGQKVQSLVQNLGYLYFNIDENKGIRQVNEITKSDYFNYLLCHEGTARDLELI